MTPRGVVAGWTILAALCGVADLPLSEAVADRHARWAQGLEHWGDVPGQAIMAAAALVLAWALAAALRRGTGRSRSVPAPLRAFALCTLWLAMLDRVLLVRITKPLWGRVRFNDLDPAREEFTAWWVVRGPTGHESFVSGHAASAWLALSLIFLVAGRPAVVRLLVVAAVVAWALVLCASRVLLGAHYASDVLFPSALALLVFAWLRRRGAGAV